MLKELTNKIKKILKDKEWTRLSLLEHGLKEYPEGYEHYEDIDITLEDVLRCIGEMEDQNKLGDYIIGGQFFTILNNEADDYEELFSWKLGNPLHEQSEETIKELNKLI